MKRTCTRLAAVMAGAAIAVTLSSCSTATEKKSDSQAASSSAVQTAHDEDDVMFAQMMIPHHQQAVELGAMAPQHTTNAELIKLAGEILKQQQPEINTMKTLLAQWGVDPEAAPHQSGHAGMVMQGMVSDDTMVKLTTLNGADFDKLWLQSMISHHQGAIEMAKTEAADGTSPEMVSLAKSIVTGQQDEITQMQKMLAAAGG